MIDFEIITVEQDKVLFKSQIPFDKNTTYRLSYGESKIELKVLNCYSSEGVHIIDAKTSSDTTNLLQALKNYKEFKKEYNAYQHTVEQTMLNLSAENVELTSRLDAMFTLVNVTNYLNQWISEEVNTARMISDMLLGILGVSYITIYLVNTRGKLMLRSTNLKNVAHHTIIKAYNQDGKPLKLIIKNGFNGECNINNVHSCLGCPIYVKSDLRGYMFVEHTQPDYVTGFHRKYIEILASQIATFLEAKRLYMELLDYANKDGLTNLYTKTYFIERVQKDIETDKRNFAICMLDIDDFKKCNDTYGHPYGDKILKEVSKVYQESLRRSDIVARYGGEEIICCLYGVKNIDDIYRRMDTLRKKVEEISIPPYKATVTISTGIALCMQDDTLEDVISNADRALYQSKQHGKNCSTVFTV